MFSSETESSVSKEDSIETVKEENKNTSFIVKYKGNVQSSAKNKLRTANITNTLKSDTSIEVINFDEEKSLEEVKEELGESNVEYIQPNYMLELAAVEENIAEKETELIIGDYSEETTEIATSANLPEVVLDKKVVVGLIDSEIDINNSEIKRLYK